MESINILEHDLWRLQDGGGRANPISGTAHDKTAIGAKEPGSCPLVTEYPAYLTICKLQATKFLK
jgi:hypothetical protein